MEITKSLIANLQVGFSKQFEGGWRETPNYIERIATRVSSKTRINTYGWMARLLQMRKWVGPRMLQNLNTHAYSLENEDFEITVGVPRNDIKDDQLGIYSPMFKQMGRQAGYLWNELGFRILRAGNATAAAALGLPTGTGFDGVAFFGSTHNLNPAANQANEGSEQLTKAGWTTVKEKMSMFVGEDGRPLGVRPNLVLVPASGGYERAAKEIFNTRLLPVSGGSNVFESEAEIIVVPELPAAGGWYALDTTAPIKPLILQVREEVQMVSKADPDDDNVFWQKEFVWGADARGAVGYGPWFLAYHATGTTPDGVT
jgi:phage major head subunit gpT-like protein